MTNEVPTIHSEGLTVRRLNSLLDTITSRPFASAALAAQSIRAALDLHGITLPVLEVEGGVGHDSSDNARFGPTTADGKFILQGVSSMNNPDMYAAPADGEWIWKIVDSDGPDDDFDDYLYLYIVMDKIVLPDVGNAVDCYAQIVSSEDLDALGDMKDDDYADQTMGTLDNIPHEGDRSGESEYQKQVRHVGGLRQEK